MGVRYLTLTPLERAVKVLEEEGYAYLPQQSEESLKALNALLGETIYVTDVVVKKDSKALVTSDRELDLHTDHPTVEYIVWYCYKQSDEGGESLLVDPLPAYLALSSDQREALKKIRLYQHKVFPDDPENFPLVSEEDGKIRFYYSFWLVDESDKYNPALLEFVAQLKKLKPITIRLNPGDILVVNNFRIFHGRTAIRGNKDRFLRRYWIKRTTKT